MNWDEAAYARITAQHFAQSADAYLLQDASMTARQAASVERQGLKHAPIIAITSDMFTLCKAAVASAPPEIVLKRSDMPLDCGWLWLPQPIPTDGEGHEGRGVLYVNSPHPSSNGAMLSFCAEHPKGGHCPCSFTLLGFGENVYDDEASRSPGATPIASVRLVITILRLMWQGLASVEPARTNRHEQRRLGSVIERATVVTLRRMAHESTDGAINGPVDWSHRWLVSGHWRNQFYPSLNDHRHIFVSPYVKGPAGKPLVMKERRYMFSR